ncbi:MAG: hypothetical protein QOD78_2339 [Chloroflexota bacterium]|nr:hypothetical protein [Chloroflexota bacterium]
MGPKRRPPSLLEQIVRSYAAFYVGRAANGILLLVLLPVVVAISVVIFAALAVIVFGAYALLGSPGPPIGTVFSLGWFVGSFVVLFLVLRRGHRWLTLAIRIADAPAAMIDPPDEDDGVIREAPDPEAFRARVAAVDARHTSPSDTPDEP